MLPEHSEVQVRFRQADGLLAKYAEVIPESHRVSLAFIAPEDFSSAAVPDFIVLEPPA